MSDDWIQEQIARQHLGMPQDEADPWNTAEFLAASCRDIETGEPLEPTARPDLYVADVLTVADEYAAMEAKIERLRAALQFYADPNTYDFPEFDMICVDPFTPIALDEGSIARAALIDKETTDEK